VLLESDGGSPEEDEIVYDHLVLAVGSVSNYPDVENLRQEAFDFKTLADAVRIRNHIIDAFERTDHEPEGEARRSMLTFVVAGGGFAGAELAGALNDFARGMLPIIPTFRPKSCGSW